MAADKRRWTPIRKNALELSAFIGVHRRPHRASRSNTHRRGTALLAVLWLSAALSAIAFAMSVTVRGETERAATSVDDLRSYYLASSGVERAAMELLFSTFGNQTLIPKDAGHIDYNFPSGLARVEIIPEASKMDVNKASVESLFRLITAIGVDPGRATTIVAAIADWRAPANGGGAFDGYYLSRVPSFQSPHASFEEIEELLAVRGVTPDIFYGTWAPAAANGDPASSTLVRHSGLVDCLTVYGGLGAIQLGAAEPAVLSAIGTAPDVIQGIATQRANGANSSEFTRIMMQGNAVFTFRSTARLKMPNGKYSDMRRTVAAQVKYEVQPSEVPYRVLRWYDTAWSN